MTDYLIGAGQKIYDWLVKGHIPEGLKLQLDLVLRLGLLIWGFNPSDTILGLCFLTKGKPFISKECFKKMEFAAF